MNCCHETTKMGGQPQGAGREAYLNGTSQASTPEDAWKDGHIRGRSHARASIHEISGLGLDYISLTTSVHSSGVHD